EVARESNAVNRESDSSGDLHVDYGQRDRYSCTPVYHFVQIAVARVVIVIDVSPESQLIEESGVDCGDEVERGFRDPRLLASEIGYPVELVEVEGCFNARILLGRDQEGCLGQVNSLVVARHYFCEPASNLFWGFFRHGNPPWLVR